VFDPPRAIAWEPGQDTDDGGLSFGGWVWRYDLTPAGPSETKVTLSYDWSAVPDVVREHIGFPPFLRTTWATRWPISPNSSTRGSRCWVHHVQPTRSPHHEELDPVVLETRGQLHAREAVQDGVQSADQLQPGEWRPDAKLDPAGISTPPISASTPGWRNRTWTGGSMRGVSSTAVGTRERYSPLGARRSQMSRRFAVVRKTCRRG
jgi:hypothetical protein